MKLTRKQLWAAGIGTAAVALIATAGISSANGLASEDTRNQLEEAVENKDYESWKSIHDEMPEITDYITSQADFEKFIEMNELYKSGDTEAADAIRDELGLPEDFRPGPSGKGGQRGEGDDQGRNGPREGDNSQGQDGSSEDGQQGRPGPQGENDQQGQGGPQDDGQAPSDDNRPDNDN